MKKLGLGAAGAIIGGVLGYATTPSVQDFIARAETSRSSFSYWHILFFHTFVGLIVGIAVGVVMAIFLAKRTAAKS